MENDVLFLIKVKTNQDKEDGITYVNEPTQLLGNHGFIYHGRRISEEELKKIGDKKDSNPWCLRGYSGIPGQEGWCTIKDDIMKLFPYNYRKMVFPWVQPNKVYILNYKLAILDNINKDIRDINPLDFINILRNKYGCDWLGKEYWDIFRDINANVILPVRYNKEGYPIQIYRFGVFF